MKVQIFLSLALFSVTWFAGCNQSTSVSDESDKPESLGVAIIDLDEIAHQLGSDKQIVSAIKQRETALNNQLKQIAQAYTAELDKQKEAMETDSDATEGGTVQLASYEQQATKNFESARTQAQQNLAQHRSQLISKFREAVRPIARKVADERGLAVIVTKQDSLLYDYDEDCDITSEVVRLLKSSASKGSTSAPKKSN